MARKSRDNGEGEGTQREEPATGNGRMVISERKLKSLLASKRKAQETINEVAGGLGEEIKSAADKHHLNKTVFPWIARLDRMEPEKLKVCIEDLQHYLDISGLNKRAESVPSMSLQPGEGGGETEAVDGEGETEAPRGRGGRNVRPFPQPAGATQD